MEFSNAILAIVVEGSCQNVYPSHRFAAIAKYFCGLSELLKHKASLILSLPTVL